jgi:hypothetical protein
MEDAVNSITRANIMLVVVINRYAYVSTVVTRDMKPVAIGHLVTMGSYSVVHSMNTALRLGACPWWEMIRKYII